MKKKKISRHSPSWVLSSSLVQVQFSSLVVGEELNEESSQSFWCDGVQSSERAARSNLPVSDLVINCHFSAYAYGSGNEAI